MSTGEFGTEPPPDEIASDQGQQANDIQHQSPGGGPLGLVVVAGLPRAFVLLHGSMVGEELAMSTDSDSAKANGMTADLINLPSTRPIQSASGPHWVILPTSAFLWPRP
jgi:hypothetical protein